MFDPTDPFYAGGAVPYASALVLGIAIILVVGWFLGRKN